MRRLGWVALRVAVLLTAGAPEVRAQTEVSPRLTISVPPVLYVGTSTGVVTFTPTASHFDAGQIVTGSPVTVTHAGNLAHRVSVAASASTWSNSSKPADHLQWSRNSGSTWTAFGTTAVNFHTSTSAASGRYDVAVLYRVQPLSYASDPPGTYSLSFTYTVVAN